MREPGELWSRMVGYYPDDSTRARGGIADSEGKTDEVLGTLACRRLVGEDRRRLITIANKVVDFASKRVAHSNPTVDVRAKFSELDDAIDLLKDLTEKYTLLIFEEQRDLLQEFLGHHGSLVRSLFEGKSSMVVKLWSYAAIAVAVASEKPLEFIWWAVQVSNLRPSACKADALPLS